MLGSQTGEEGEVPMLLEAFVSLFLILQEIGSLGSLEQWSIDDCHMLNCSSVPWDPQSSP